MWLLRKCITESVKKNSFFKTLKIVFRYFCFCIKTVECVFVLWCICVFLLRLCVCVHACLYAGCLCEYVMVSLYVITFCVNDFVRLYISGFACVYLGMWVRFMPLVSICAFMYNCVGMFMCLSVFVHFCLLCCDSNYFDQIFAASIFTFHGFCFELWTEADK